MMQAGNRILVNYALIKIQSSAHPPFIVTIGFDKVSYTTVRSTAFESLVLNEQGNPVCQHNAEPSDFKIDRKSVV